MSAAGVPEYELVVVGYHSRPQIEGLLAGLPAGIPVVLVDNSGGQDGLPELAAGRPGTRWLDGGGKGFAHGATLGAGTSSREYVVFVNPDARPTAADLDALVTSVAADRRVVSAGATMVSADGTVELGTAGWEPSVRRALVHAAGIHKLLPRAGLFARPRPYGPLRVDWTTGACMAVRRAEFMKLGGFDERFYVYNEDVAFGRTVREHGQRQVLRTDVLVPHASGGSGAPSLEMMRLRGASMARYVNRHNPPAHAAAIRAALAAGYLTRVVAQIAVARNVPRAREHLSYVAGLLTGRASVAGREVAGGA